MNFCGELKSFINQNYDGKICTNRILTDAYEHITVVDKNTVYLLIPLPVHSFDKSQKMFFQNLSITAAQQNLQLIIIWEDNWIIRNDIIRWRILSHLGKFIRVHGRLCEVRRIIKTQADEFLLQNHLHGSPQTKHKYGLFFAQQLIAVATFSSGRSVARNEKIYRSYELVRFANHQNYIVYGGTGKMIAHFVAEQNPDDIMSYADVDWSSGKSYEKLGFQFIEYTEPQKFYLDVKTCHRYYPKKLPQELSDEFQKQSLSLDDFLSKHNIFTIYNAGNKKYLLKLK
jgi:hypothetical protein